MAKHYGPASGPMTAFLADLRQEAYCHPEKQAAFKQVLAQDIAGLGGQ